MTRNPHDRIIDFEKILSEYDTPEYLAIMNALKRRELYGRDPEGWCTTGSMLAPLYKEGGYSLQEEPILVPVTGWHVFILQTQDATVWVGACVEASTDPTRKLVVQYLADASGPAFCRAQWPEPPSIKVLEKLAHQLEHAGFIQDSDWPKSKS